MTEITAHAEGADFVTVVIDGTAHALAVDDAYVLTDRLLDAIRAAHAAYEASTLSAGLDAEEAPPVESSPVPRSLAEWPLDRLEQFVAELGAETDPTQPHRLLDLARGELDRRRAEQP